MAYVKVEELRERLYDSDTITFKGLAIIDNFPTADVEEVKHGYWKTTVAEKNGNAYCSVCNNFDWNDCNYCSKCGAKMDGAKMSEIPTGSERSD